MTDQIQGTKEWHAWRHEGIGASEAPIIMGVSRFKTSYELWQQKIEPTPPTDKRSYYMDKGHEMERIARAQYCLETMTDWQPVLVVHPENKRLRASLDGWDEDEKAVWECKYMGIEKWTNVQDENLTTRQRVSKEYYPQLMHQALVTGSKRIHFTGIVDHKILKELVKGQTKQYTFVFNLSEEDLRYIEGELLPALNKFLVCIDTQTAPGPAPIPKEETVVVDEDKELSGLLEEYDMIKNQLTLLTTDEKELKKKIFGITLKRGKKVRLLGHSITETTTAKKIIPDYQKYVEEKALDIVALGYTKTVAGRKTQKITKLKKKGEE